jgi:hypothetical protein
MRLGFHKLICSTNKHHGDSKIDSKMQISDSKMQISDSNL